MLRLQKKSHGETGKIKKIFQENMVFVVSFGMVTVIALVGLTASEAFDSYARKLMAFLKEYFSWMYLLVMFLVVIFLLVLAFSKYGAIRLGADDSRPEYSTLSWFAMLFCAGMGVGLVFWGIAEPLSHYVNPIGGVESMTEEAARFAIRSSFMHWGLQPWGAYSIIGLGLAYFQFRKKQPGLISSICTPIIGEKGVKGTVGKVIDIFSIIMSVAGVAASFGIGCLQISGGLNFLWGVPNRAVTWLIIITIVCMIYLASSIGGLDKGIKKLSDINLCLAGFLMCLAFLIGPTTDILNIFTNGIGEYLSCFISDSLGINPFGENEWVGAWKVFYWAWWIAWAPLVGIFIARISKGRTIREFILGVMAAPTLASVVWFSVFGGMALHVTDRFTSEQLAVITASPETAPFIIYTQYPLGTLLSVITIIVLIIFFITSADSATFVLSMLSSEGNMNPPNLKKVVWGIMQALIAFVLLYSGGVSALQTASIASAFPFMFIIVIACVSLAKSLKSENKI